MSSPETSAIFRLLADPDGYVACSLGLMAQDDRRAYWIDLFRRHIVSLIEQAKAQDSHDPRIDERARIVERHFNEYLDAITQQPECFGHLSIMDLCRARQRAVRAAGIDDPYRAAKARENEAAFPLLPALFDQLDALSENERPQRIIEGIFAGNIFDLGATQTLDLVKGGNIDFHATRRKLKPRPWLIDDLDRWLVRWNAEPHHSAVLFVDNAGCDILLGMVPLARELLRHGTNVLLTANTRPSLNDVTHDELTVLIGRVARHDAVVRDALDDGRLELVPSGNGLPLIDLLQVSSELDEAVRQRHVDLVVIEGMGRAIESNFETAFTCDVLKIAMLKDPGVGEVLGGGMFDLVLKFEPV